MKKVILFFNLVLLLFCLGCQMDEIKWDEIIDDEVNVLREGHISEEDIVKEINNV